MTDVKEQNDDVYIAVKTWDVQTRVLHWLNALIVIALALFALTMWKVESLGLPDEVSEMLMAILKKTHTYLGYFLAMTFTLRLILGFVGSRYARFSDMISFKKEHWRAIAGNIKWYLSGFKGDPPVAIGHNPLASLFYIPLFVVLISQVISGVILAGLEYEIFPGTFIMEKYGLEGVDAWGMAAERAHVLGLYFILLFFLAHMAGLVVHEIGERCGLFSSMINGRKYFKKESI